MRKLIFIFILLLASNAYAQTGSTVPIFGRDQCIWFEEEDGSPVNTRCAKMQVSNNSMTDTGTMFVLDTGGLTQEETEDLVGAMMNGVETRIVVTYDDTNGLINFVVDDMTIDGQDESVPVTDPIVSINCTGAGVTCTNNAGVFTFNIPGIPDALLLETGVDWILLETGISKILAEDGA